MIKVVGFLISLIILFDGCKSKVETISTENLTSGNLYDKYANDSIRAEIFEIAYMNKSTAPSYIVFKAKDLNTGKTKEICCEAPFLSGALLHELNTDCDFKNRRYFDSLILANRNSIFEFKTQKALKNIRFFRYPNKEKIDSLAMKTDIDYYYNKYGQNDSTGLKVFGFNSNFLQLSFAHIMFKCGIITSRDCVDGNNIWFGDPNLSMPDIPNKRL